MRLTTKWSIIDMAMRKGQPYLMPYVRKLTIWYTTLSKAWTIVAVERVADMCVMAREAPLLVVIKVIHSKYCIQLSVLHLNN